jgi:hypothetical protein
MEESTHDILLKLKENKDYKGLKDMIKTYNFSQEYQSHIASLDDIELVSCLAKNPSISAETQMKIYMRPPSTYWCVLRRKDMYSREKYNLFLNPNLIEEIVDKVIFGQNENWYYIMAKNITALKDRHLIHILTQMDNKNYENHKKNICIFHKSLSDDVIKAICENKKSKKFINHLCRNKHISVDHLVHIYKTYDQINIKTSLYMNENTPDWIKKELEDNKSVMKTVETKLLYAEKIYTWKDDFYHASPLHHDD